MQKAFHPLFVLLFSCFSYHMALAQKVSPAPPLADSIAAKMQLMPTPLLLYRTHVDALPAEAKNLKVRLFQNGQLLKEQVVHLEKHSGQIVFQPFSTETALLKQVVFGSKKDATETYVSVHAGDQILDEFELSELAKLSWQQNRLAPKVGVGSPDFWQAGNARLFFGKTLAQTLYQPSQDLSLYYQLKHQPDMAQPGIQSLTITVDDRLFAIDRFEIQKQTTTLALFAGREKPLRALYDLYQKGSNILVHVKFNGETQEVIPFEDFLNENMLLAEDRGWRGQAALQPSIHRWANFKGDHVAQKSGSVQQCYDDCDAFEISCMSGCSDEFCFEQCQEEASDCAYDCFLLEDNDQDGINNGSDNCLTVANPNQQDCDGDGQGSACDPNDWHVTGDTGWSSWVPTGQGYRCRPSGFLWFVDLAQCQQRTRTITETNCYNNQQASTLFVQTQKVYQCGLILSSCPPNVGGCTYGSGPCP